MLQDYPKKYKKLFEDISFKYVIIPIQSGSKKIIDNMNRDYDPNKVVKIVDQIKKVSPKTIFYSHFILNFPGEKLLDFIKTIITTFHFDIPLPFIYCPMKGTVSASTTKKQSKSLGVFKWFIFLFMINFIILFKIIKYQK
jgi:tRNA A37 methylthiotransferase MiaB